jgi:hypothetical protein
VGAFTCAGPTEFIPNPGPLSQDPNDTYTIPGPAFASFASSREAPVAKAEASHRLGRGRPWLLLPVGNLPERQSAVEFSAGTKGNCLWLGTCRPSSQAGFTSRTGELLRLTLRSTEDPHRLRSSRWPIGVTIRLLR